jgi:RHS repeat-associated protein
VATTDFTYDSANRLSGIAHKQGSTNLNTYAYTYDPLSRIATIVSTLEGTDTYSYDQTSQLVGATHTSQSNETYGFDANGNQNTTGFTTGTNNQTTAGLGFTYTFDDEGNRTSKTETATGKVEEYTWDSRNRLTKVVFRNSSGGAIVKQVDYEYDPYNRLVHRTFDADGAGSGAATDQFWVYDEGINAVLQFDGSSASNLSHRYLWSNNVDELLADEQVAGSNTLWGLADHLGSLRDIADLNEGTGVTSITNHRTFNSFGKLISETNAAVDMLFAFTGKHYDDATALQHNLFRWYDPAIGQWLIEDPLSFAAGDENVRRYVGNDAILRLDPLGLYNQDEIDQIKTSALSTLEKAGLYKAKALKENEDYDRLTKAQNRLRDDDQGFYIRDIFDCSEYARIAIATLRESIGDTRLRIDYIRGRNETMEDLLLDASARSQVESHAMMLFRIKDQYLVYDPQTGNSSNWQTGNESQALKAAAELYNKHYSDIQEKADDDVRAAIDSFTKFSIVDVKDYANKDMNSAAYKLFLQAVKENGGKPSLLPPIPNTPSFNPNRPRK